MINLLGTINIPHNPCLKWLSPRALHLVWAPSILVLGGFVGLISYFWAWTIERTYIMIGGPHRTLSPLLAPTQLFQLSHRVPPLLFGELDLLLLLHGDHELVHEGLLRDKDFHINFQWRWFTHCFNILAAPLSEPGLWSHEIWILKSSSIWISCNILQQSFACPILVEVAMGK